MKPSFFIIGERKCGTSSLYRYLLAHPNVLPGDRKEMQFFTREPQFVRENFASYLARFPEEDGDQSILLHWPELDEDGTLHEEEVSFPRTKGHHYTSGEASADTFCDADPSLLKELLPDLRLILILRDPAERAFSHHRMFHRFAQEGRDLGFAVGDFANDMRLEMQQVVQGHATPCLSPSLYQNNLERWLTVWGTQLLVLFSAHLDSATQFPFLMNQVLVHLDLPPKEYVLERRFNQAPPATMSSEIRNELQGFFAPYDKALQAQLGCPLPWRDSP